MNPCNPYFHLALAHNSPLQSYNNYCKFPNFWRIIFLKNGFFRSTMQISPSACLFMYKKINQAPRMRCLTDAFVFRLSLGNVSTMGQLCFDYGLLQHELLTVLDHDALVGRIHLLSHDVIHRLVQVEALLCEHFFNAGSKRLAIHANVLVT